MLKTEMLKELETTLQNDWNNSTWIYNCLVSVEDGIDYTGE